MTNVWPTKPLRDLGTWYGGGTPSKSRPEFWEGGDVPWLSPKDMGAGVIGGTRDHITAAAIEHSAARLVPNNSVAVVMRSGILERTLPVACVPFATTLNQDMKAISPVKGVDPRWIAFGLRAHEQELLATTRKDGTTVASIETRKLQAFMLPVPPLVEQLQIIEALEYHFSRLDSAEAGLRAVALRGRTLINASSASLIRKTEADESVPQVRLSDIAKIGSGSTPKRGVGKYWLGGTIPWITSGDLAQGDITAAKQFLTQTALAETSVKIWPAGTLLVAMYGEGKTRGTVAELSLDATTNQACAAITLNGSSSVERAWVRLVLESRYDALRRESSGGVQPNLTLGYFKSLSLPWPGSAQAAMLVDEHHSFIRRAERLDQGVRCALNRSERLRRALLVAAFRGELTGRRPDVERVEEMAGV